MVRKRDLRDFAPGQVLPNGGYLEPIRQVLRCTECGETYSGHVGDYCQLGPDAEIVPPCCAGAEFEQGRYVQTWVPDTPESGA